MSLKINFKGVENTTKGTRLPFGINEVTITGIEFSKEDWEGTPYVAVTFVNDEGELTEKFYLSTAALPRLKHLLVALEADESIISGEVTEKQLETITTGKKVRIKVTGREYKNSEGLVKVARQLDFSGFAEPVTVSKEDSKLRFSKDRFIKTLTGYYRGEVAEANHTPTTVEADTAPW